MERCYTLDGAPVLPERMDGMPVTELDRYFFSQTVRGREVPPEELNGEPELCGSGLDELTLPEYLRKIGPYAFYNCFHLKTLSFWSTVEDWGAGVFTGCTGIKHLKIRVVPGRKSCFKEVLSELRQELMADYLNPEGRLLARLVFPEFFEESVENTPARIIMREMHGCGHMYRYCFDGGEFDFWEYDRLFPYVRAQEPEEFVSKLALCRLCFPAGLRPEAEEEYRAYIREHPAAAARAAMAEQDAAMTARLAKEARERGQLLAMIGEAEQAGNAAALALFMDRLHRRFKNEGAAGRRFEL